MLSTGFVVGLSQLRGWMLGAGVSKAVISIGDPLVTRQPEMTDIFSND